MPPTRATSARPRTPPQAAAVDGVLRIPLLIVSAWLLLDVALVAGFLVVRHVASLVLRERTPRAGDPQPSRFGGAL